MHQNACLIYPLQIPPYTLIYPLQIDKYPLSQQTASVLKAFRIKLYALTERIHCLESPTGTLMFTKQLLKRVWSNACLPNQDKTLLFRLGFNALPDKQDGCIRIFVEHPFCTYCSEDTEDILNILIYFEYFEYF